MALFNLPRSAMFPAISRRQLLILAGSAAVLAACGDDDGDATSTDSAGAPESQATDRAPSTSDAPPATSTNSGTAASDNGTTHVLTDEYGDVEVPVDPQRVVFMDGTTLGNALALGFPAERIAGVAFAETDLDQYYGYLSEFADLNALTNVGDLTAPNLEAIAAVDPDLIVILSLWDESYAQLKEMGVPVYCALNGYNSVDEMMELLRDCGDVLGLRPRADELEADLRAKVDAIVARFEGQRPSVNALRVFAESDIWIQAHPLFDLMEMPRQAPAPPALFQELSQEELALADADLLWVSGSVGLDEARRIVEAHPLWPTMNAVTSGVVRYVEDTPWGTDYSYPALSMNFDEIEAGLTAYLDATG
jgi:iron complex transport system substrate-binding protein